MLSKCHKAEVEICHYEDGQYYRCMTCHRGCDTLFFPITETEFRHAGSRNPPQAERITG